MEPTKCRAKSKLNGKWNYGSFVKGEYEDWDYIIPLNGDLSGDGLDFYKIRVISNSVGQFTGKSDKHGNEIFAGDIDKDGSIVMFYNNAFQMCPLRNGEVVQA